MTDHPRIACTRPPVMSNDNVFAWGTVFPLHEELCSPCMRHKTARHWGTVFLYPRMGPERRATLCASRAGHAGADPPLLRAPPKGEGGAGNPGGFPFALSPQRREEPKGLAPAERPRNLCRKFEDDQRGLPSLAVLKTDSPGPSWRIIDRAPWEPPKMPAQFISRSDTIP